MEQTQAVTDLISQLEYAETHGMRRAVLRIEKALAILGVEVETLGQLGA